MHFEKPKPEDFDIDLPLKEAGCLITVRKCRDFNDETAHRLFPQSSASYVASHTYTIPSNYFSETFWKKEEKRLTNIRRIWAANKHRLSSEDLEGHELFVCKADVQKLLDMCDWLMHMRWDGDRSQPPMPLHLYKARLNELKNENDFVVKRLQSICEDAKPTKVHMNEKRSSLSATKECSSEKSRGSDSKENEKPGQSRSWKIIMMERINNILGILDAAASAGENVAQALTMLMVIRQCIKKGKDSYEDVQTKMKKLDELVAELQKASKANNEKVSPSIGKKPLAKSTASVMNTPTATTARKRGRPKSLKTRDDEEYAEKRKSMPAILSTEKCSVETETTDDLVSRVKRGQRTRRPARAFTPGWELSPSPSPPPQPPSRFRNSPKPSPLKLERKQAAGSKSLSPDSGRPSSNESSDTATASVVQATTVTKVPTEVQPNVSQENLADLPASPAPLPPTSYTNSAPPTSYTNSAPPTTPSFANFSTPTISSTVKPKVVLSPPPLPQLSEQAIMAILRERVQLGDVRLTLLNLCSNDGIPTYHFVPVMIELAEKAIAALDSKDMIVYAMYKAALDAGCAQLGTIMQASNPSDPTKQIANLATSMGISPSQFTAMMQPPANTTPVAPNALSGMQTGAYPTLPQDYPLNAYSVVAAPVDMNFQGYVERDISSFLL